MAVRKISTRLAIEGDAEYKSRMSQINSEVKAQTSALKMVESQYRSNSSSMEALTAKGKALQKLYEVQKRKVDELKGALENAQRAQAGYQKQIEDLNGKIKKNEELLDELKNSTGDTSQEQAALTAENEKWNQQLEECNARLEAATKGVNDWQTKLNTAQGDIYELDAELEKNREVLSQTRAETDKNSQAIAGHREATEKQKAALNDLSVILAGSQIPQGLHKIKEALVACVDASKDFESAMAGVKKTTDLTDDELAAMGDEFKRLSTEMPITAVGLAGIAESAGQLGIQKDRLVEFTITMANLGVATNLTSEEAATLLARFANVTGMDPSKYENLGSVVVDLGNNFATTESEIINMGQRLSSAGRLAGLTEPQIMALAASMSSVGIEAEAGGTTMTKSLTDIEKAVESGGKKLETFASIAGMSASGFAETWKNAPIEAVQAFLSGLGKLDEQGESATTVLEELGISSIRQSNTLKSLSLASDMLSRAVNTANNAWNENNALAKEAATRYETTESKFQMFQNSVDNLKIAVGDQLNPALGDLAEKGTDALNWAADFVESNRAIVPAVAAVTAGLAVFTGAATLSAVASTSLATAIKAATAAALHNPFILAATAVAILGTAIFTLVSNSENGTKRIEELSQAASNLKSTLEDSETAYQDNITSIQASANMARHYIERLKELEAIGLKTDSQQREYHSILALLCETVPELSQYIDLQNDVIDGGTDGLLKNTKAWEENAKVQAYQEKLTEIYKAQADVTLEAEKNQIGLTEATVKYSNAEKEKERILEKLAKLEEAAQKKAEAKAKETGVLADKTEFLGQRYYNLSDIMRELDDEMAEAAGTASTYQTAIEKDSEAIEEANDQAELSQKAYERLTSAQDDNTTTTLNNAAAAEESAKAQETQEAAVKNVRDMMEELAQAYRNAYEEAYNNISGQTGLFGEFTAELSEDTDTVEEMMERWAKQAENVGNYTKNLKLAAQYGIDDGLLKSLSDGSAESAAYLQVIIDKYQNLGATSKTTKEDIERDGGPLKAFSDQFNGAYQVTEEKKDAFSNTVVSMRDDLKSLTTEVANVARDMGMEDITAAFQEAFTLKGVDYNAIGVNFTEGLAEGISGNTERVEYSAEEVAELTLDKLREKLGIHSPSTVTHEIGENFDAGLSEGIQDGAESVFSTIQGMTGKIESTMKESAQKAVQKFIGEFDKISARTKARVENLRQIISTETAPLPGEMQGVGEQMVNGMISGMNNRSTALYHTVQSIVSGALETANRTAEVHSPSKKTERTFEFVGEGMIVGLEHKREELNAAVQNIVNDALKLDISGKVETLISGIDYHMPVISYPEPASAEAKPTYQIGDIKVEIHTETDDPDKLYREFTTRLKRDVEKDVRSKRG